MQLTGNFALSEFELSQTAARHGLDNTAPPELIPNLRRLAALLEVARRLLGDRAIVISSGYRSPTVNALVGGSPNSAHMDGRAADFTCPGFGDPVKVAQGLASTHLEFDQLILEFGRWVHIGIAPEGQPFRKQVLTIDAHGTHAGLHLLPK